ncbi:uncharacterized protein LOC124414771 [Diprion similis]|uniref:uncharacterized protein LOC124414771 n=1 Tax=Diprion similis TaxID=362088 RepID=UPI001EF7CAA6|nr:uncharacterized protein LOC124414771 [Diprion similis]
MEAKELCEKDGARLALADNREIYEYLIKDSPWMLHVGIYYAFEQWISIRDVVHQCGYIIYADCNIFVQRQIRPAP